MNRSVYRPILLDRRSGRHLFVCFFFVIILFYLTYYLNAAGRLITEAVIDSLKVDGLNTWIPWDDGNVGAVEWFIIQIDQMQQSSSVFFFI